MSLAQSRESANLDSVSVVMGRGEAMAKKCNIIHKNSFDLGAPIIALPGVAMFLRGQSTERRYSSVVFDDIPWSDNIFETVAFGYLPAFLAFASNDQNSIVFRDHFSHGGMTTDELCWGNFYVELTRQIDAAFCFSLATTICKKDIRTLVC